MSKVQTLAAAAAMTAQSVLAKPSTLLEMAGVEIPFDPKSAVVVLIDYQREYTTGKLPLYRVGAAVAETKRLLEWARSENLPIAHVLHQGARGGVFDLETDGGKVISELTPRESEKVIFKTLPNSFAGTDLEKWIKGQGKNSIIFAGLMSHMCLEASVRSAVDHGFNSLVVASTTTTRDLPGAGGSVVTATELTTAALAALQDLVAIVDDGVEEVQARFEK